MILRRPPIVTLILALATIAFASYAAPGRMTLAAQEAAPVAIPAGVYGPAGDAERPRPIADAAREGEPAPIADDLDVDKLTVPAWETGKVGAIPPSAAPDIVGAFRFICEPGHLGYDDPIVFPGQPGKSHLHQFFGNTKADAYSTYASLRTSGESTCMNALNRSAYWIPAMLNGRGQVVRPDYVTIYYKRQPATSNDCTVQAKRCGQVPRGLRYVFGFDMVTGKVPTGGGYFICIGKGAAEQHLPNIVEAARQCPAGSKLGALISSPNCWDGKRTDSPNHRDHVAYTSYGNWGYPRCPAGHPVLIPTFTLGAWYDVDDTLAHDGTPSWRLSSDEMPGNKLPPGSTLHADWFGAWDDATLQAWTDHCIDKMLNCSGGDLGNGRQLKQVSRTEGDPALRLVPVPPRVVAMAHH